MNLHWYNSILYFQGDKGESQLKCFNDDLDLAVKAYEKKFKDKTKNAWKDRENFKPASGKYTLIEMDEEADSQEVEEMEQKVYTYILNIKFMPKCDDVCKNSFSIEFIYSSLVQFFNEEIIIIV